MKPILLLSAISLALIGCDNRPATTEPPAPEVTAPAEVASPSPSPIGTPLGGAPMTTPPNTGTQDQSLVAPTNTMPATTPAPTPATP